MAPSTKTWTYVKNNHLVILFQLKILAAIKGERFILNQHFFKKGIATDFLFLYFNELANILSMVQQFQKQKSEVIECLRITSLKKETIRKTIVVLVIVVVQLRLSNFQVNAWIFDYITTCMPPTTFILEPMQTIELMS